MGRKGQELGPESIPQDVKQLKCELYPKNAEQMWGSYKEYCEGYDFYDDAKVKEAIENSWYVAHDVIGDVSIDTSMKLPSFGLRPGLTPFQTLVELCKEGLRMRQLSSKPEYVARIKTELNVIKQLDNAMYFLTLKAVLDVAKRELLIGCGRGCFVPGTRVLMADGFYAPIDTINVGDVVIDAHGDPRSVLNVLDYDVDEELVELTFEDGRVVKCTKDHKFLTSNRGYIAADELSNEDDVIDVKE
jgi:major membrane immunogen (membrane-anchored lipoprotein)